MILQSRLKRPRRSIHSSSQARLWRAASACIESLERRVLLSTADATLLADASVNSASPDTNTGGAADLFVQDPGSATQITYLKFDISGITPINSATLELNGSLTNAGDPATTVGVFAVSDNTWTENGITFNNAPAVGSAISGATGTISSTTPAIIDINLTSFIQSQQQASNTTISLAIESSTPSADPAQFTSDSGGTAPALVIDDTPPSAPTGTLTASAVSSANTQETVVAEYSGPAAINLGTIASSNLSISGPSSAAIGSVASVNASNPDDVFATYDITAPNGSTWTIANNGTYTVTLKANQVQDANSNFVATTNTTFGVNISDTTAPVVKSISAPAITSTGSENEAITVVYTDNVAVSAGTIGVNNISVSGPGGSRNASSVNTSPSSNAATITATYQIAAPSGGWTLADNGSYNISIGAGTVTDTSGNGVAAASSTYSVNVSDTTPPVASSISAPNITVVGGDTQTVTVVYTDNVAVNDSSIGTSDITVTGGPASLSVTGVSTNPSSNSSLITATYTVTKTNNQPWAVADNGTYTITVVADAVTDTSGNGVATKTGTFTVGLPQPDTTPPTDTITAPNVTAPGGATETITVVYTDNVAVNTATITNSSVSVTGPGGALTLSNLTTLPGSNGPTITAIYTFSAPGGAWAASDNGTYTVTVAANVVKDTSGNSDAGNSTTFTVNATVPDTTPPVAVLTAPNVTAPGAATEVVTAVYTDNVAVNVNSITASNITVAGPAGALTVSGVTVTGSGATVTAAYAVRAPGGAWAATANGSYTVTLGAAQVTDTSANPAATTSTTFTVDATVPNLTPPAVNIIAPNLTSASLADEQIIIVYTDAGIVDASTIKPSNLTVTGPNGALTVASVSNTPAGNAATITATYSVTPQNGGWTSTSNGTYQVTLRAGQVKDTSNNAAPATTSSFTVNIPAPGNPNDPTFNSGNPVSVSFTAEGSAVLSNGQIAIIGEEGNASAGKSQGVIELFNADGSVATGFGTSGIILTPQSANEAFHAVIAQGDNIIVAGSGGGFLLQRYNTSGQLDGSFGTSGSVVTNFGSTNEAAFALAESPNGDIVAAGTANGNVAFAEYNANGGLVTSFGQGGRQLFDVGSSTGVIGAVAFQSDGDLVAVGSSSAQVILVRLNTSGDADSTFGTSGLVIVPSLVANTSLSTGDHSEGLAIEPDNTILVANQTASGHFGIVHLDANGNVISSFGTNGLATASFGSDDDADYVAVQPGGQIIVAGTTNVSGTPTAIAAFDQTGAPIASFGLLGKLLLPASVSASNELVSGSNVTSVFGAQTSDGHIFLGTAGGTSSIRKLSVAGTQNENAGTPLGSFGVSGKKNVKLATTIAGTKVTIGITGGTGQAFLATNGLHLVISAGAKGASLTITCAGGKRSVTLGDVTVSGSLKLLSSKSANLAGTLSTTGTIGTLSLGNLDGGVIAAPGGINSLSLVSASDAKVLAGANLGADGELGGSGADADTFFSASLRTFKVTGSVTNSVFAAGVDPIDGLYAPGDDTVIGGKASIIRTISVRKIDASSRFIAGAFGTAGLPKKAKPASDPHFEIL